MHQHILDLGYTADLTALHLMMDVGFPVVKPDIVLSRLFLGWGWLQSTVGTRGHVPLPSDLSLTALRSGGVHSYVKPSFYLRIIDLASSISKRLEEMRPEVDRDIAWSTANQLREFDLFVVKYGQEPDPVWGLTANLARRNVKAWPAASQARRTGCELASLQTT